jgi:hypothetical protein
MLGGLVGTDAVVRRIMEKVSMATRDEDKRAALGELKEKSLTEPRAVAAASFEPLMEVRVPCAETLEGSLCLGT